MLTGYFLLNKFSADRENRYYNVACRRHGGRCLPELSKQLLMYFFIHVGVTCSKIVAFSVIAKFQVPAPEIPGIRGGRLRSTEVAKNR